MVATEPAPAQCLQSRFPGQSNEAKLQSRRWTIGYLQAIAFHDTLPPKKRDISAAFTQSEKRCAPFFHLLRNKLEAATAAKKRGRLSLPLRCVCRVWGTTGGVEIGSQTLHPYNVLLLAIYLDGILHKFTSNISSHLCIASNRFLWYNTDTMEKVAFYESRRHSFIQEGAFYGSIQGTTESRAEICQG